MIALRLRFRFVSLFLSGLLLVQLAGCRSDRSGPDPPAGDRVYRVSTGENPEVVGQIGTPGEDPRDHHYGSIREALEARREAPEEDGKRIVVHGGRYYLDRPLAITSRDSGLTIEAAPGTEPVLYGGEPVTGWEKDGGDFYAADLPADADPEDVRMLVVNGELRPRARRPKDGYFRHRSTFDVHWPSASAGGWARDPTWKELTTLKYNPEDVGPDLNVENAELTVYHQWDTSQVGLRSIDPDEHVMRFSNPAGHPPGAFGVKKYVIRNTRGGMHEPGQWYVDRTRARIVYWPRPGEEMDEARVLAPVTDRVIRVRGARDVTLKGLGVSLTTTPLIAGGFGADDFPGAVDASYVENGRFENLHIFHVAGQGLRVDEEVNVTIEGGRIHDTGACGILAPGAVIRDNTVHHVGKLYPAAIGIKAGGRGCIISRNHVHHTPYSGIICGGSNHRITRNHIHDVMREMHDGAAIYSFSGRKVVMRNNYAHDISRPDDDSTAAYYLDERSRNCVVERNVTDGVQRPMNNHMARDNTIRNNVFVNDGDLRMKFPRSSGYTFERNVLVAGGRITFLNANAIDTWTGNVLHSRSGRLIDAELKKYEVIRKHSLNLPDGNETADPRLQLRNGRVSYSPDSIVHELGIEPIDVSRAGPIDPDQSARNEGRARHR